MAAEHLTREEQADLRESFWDKDSDDTLALVERIVARHRAEVAEEVAQAIEAAAVAADVDMVEIHGAFVRRAPYAAEHLRDAARIAREHKERRPGHGL